MKCKNPNCNEKAEWCEKCINLVSNELKNEAHRYSLLYDDYNLLEIDKIRLKEDFIKKLKEQKADFIKKLEILLNKHRDMITCREDCFCWDINTFLIALEEKE